MLKEKVIFIIALILIITGVSYLGLTLYRFIKSPLKKSNSQQVSDTKDSSTLELIGSSNQDVIKDNVKKGESIGISISIKNTSPQTKRVELEGRVYKVQELLSFPNIDSDLPVDTKEISLTIKPKEIADASYTYISSECGNFYIALATKDFWSTGRGLVSYGYFAVPCKDRSSYINNNKPINTTKGGLTLYDQKKQELQKKQVLGVTNSQNSKTKGGLTTADSSANPSQLPKSGSTENILILLGICFIALGFLKFNNLD